MSKFISSQFIFIIDNVTELSKNAVFALIDSCLNISQNHHILSKKGDFTQVSLSSRNSGMYLYGQLYIYI